MLGAERRAPPTLSGNWKDSDKVDDSAVARSCRRSLDQSLRVVHALTTDPRCAAELLLQRATGVLRAAVDSNFGAASHGAIDALYESIGRMQLGMVARCEDLPFLYFSRAFAPVVEWAVRLLQPTRGVAHHSVERPTGGRASMRSEEAEETAVVCRTNLRDSLLVAEKLLRAKTTPIELLLARMADVLAVIVESIFGPASYYQLRRLYMTIEQLQPEMMEKCENVPLCFFARSLAVVLEEAMRQLQTTPSPVPSPPSSPSSSSGCSSCSRSTCSTCSTQSSGDRSSPGSRCSQPPAAGGAATAAEPAPEEQWERGRILVSRIPQATGAREVRLFVRAIGFTKDVHYHRDSRGRGYALVQFEIDRLADEAVARLHGTLLHGQRVAVKRATLAAAPTRPRAAAAAAPAPSSLSAVDH